MTPSWTSSPALYAELEATTNFTFLTGASHPDELAVTAAALGHAALAVTDRNSLAGVVRAHQACKDVGLKFVVGCRLDFEDAASLLVWPTDREAYARLSTLLTIGRRRAPKGECLLSRADLAGHAAGLIAAIVPPDEIDDADLESEIKQFQAVLETPPYLRLRARLDGRDARLHTQLQGVADRCGIETVATNAVLMHDPARRPLLDVLTCIREKTTVEAAGWRLAANAEAHLKPPEEMRRLFRDHPQAVANTLTIAAACTFSLDELRYEYPDDPVPEGSTAQAELERLARAGAAEKYPDGLPDTVRDSLDRELKIIGELDYAPYFLTVHDIVSYARAQDILCQGRGSAANSVVCFCLGVTSVDPTRIDLLFERFVSAARNEPPDIDVDFEHERREEVIQYIYRRYGRDRAGLAATVITYRTRSAIRDVGKALGLSEDVIAALASSVWSYSSEFVTEKRVRECGLDPSDQRLRMVLGLAQELRGFPRHLSQHVGGFVLTRRPLHELVPIENAAMADRTVIQWDKDDLDALGMLKVDVLSLGMLTCIRKALDLVARHHDRHYDLASVPPEDPAVYDMLCQADSLGVFQVESRAQMNMLPRLRPRCFYDLVIQVAIVRPGPIQGGMVHPYLRRRMGQERVTFPSKELYSVLNKTLGVPLFQEQAMKIAMVAAGFSAVDADRLRRAMAAFRRSGSVHTFQETFVSGMLANGYARDFAEACFRQIEGFGEYGFPESHAASFARLVYVSAWLKCHYPAAFAAALLNSQPMGFYAPAQIVQDARRHGVEVRPVDVNASDWDCSLEPFTRPGGRADIALRLGFRQVKGLTGNGTGPAMQALLAARTRPYADVEDVWRRADAPVSLLERLAAADVFAGLGLSRRDALWQVKRLKDSPLPLFEHARRREPDVREHGVEPMVHLPDLLPGEQVVEDYSTLRLTLRDHPMALLRPHLVRERLTPAARLMEMKDGATVTVAGLATCRQRPGSANGVLFVTLEDETGNANCIVWASLFEAQRREAIRSRLLAIEGTVQKQDGVVHVVAKRLIDMTPRLRALAPEEATLEHAPARADVTRHTKPLTR